MLVLVVVATLPEAARLAAAGAVATLVDAAAAAADYRVAAPAWKDTQEEAQLKTLRAALTAISAAETELEDIRRQDEAHLREQEEAVRERRQQAERLEKAELQIRQLAASSGTPLATKVHLCSMQSVSVSPC